MFGFDTSTVPRRSSFVGAMRLAPIEKRSSGSVYRAPKLALNFSESASWMRVGPSLDAGGLGKSFGLPRMKAVALRCSSVKLELM
jgi:hypothetical protein